MPRPASRLLALLFVLAWPSGPAVADSRTIARHGSGFLEEVDGSKVLHLKGTPREMGLQHGVLLRDDIREQVRYLFDVKAKEFKPELFGLKVPLDAKRLILSISRVQRKFVPAKYYEEMEGIAEGSGVAVEEVIASNFIPEMFHCSGFALAGSATKDGTLYHGRILDYGCDWKLQDHAVLVVAEPNGSIPFVNVTYAGFIGSVTGMNARKISIGEMGGGGLGHWEGVPMAILVRMALESADDLDEAVAIFRDNPRTCQYFYVVADGNSGKAVGMEASWNAFTTVKMGEAEPRLPHAFPDAVLLSIGSRYEELSRRVEAGHGKFDARSARDLMARPVAMKSNLHSVLFETTTGKFWVANASTDGEPAANQPYHAFSLPELLARKPVAEKPVKVDLRTKAGAESVKAEWRYSDAKLVEVPHKAPDGKPNTTYAVSPRAQATDFDDSKWEIIDPTTLGSRRSSGLVCFCWYRVALTMPEGVEGKTVTFSTTVDDYGEVWVDGQLPRKVGQVGGNIVAGFNTPNVVELKDPKPGKVYHLAIFGINGPISAMPENYIFLGPTYLEISGKK